MDELDDFILLDFGAPKLSCSEEIVRKVPSAESLFKHIEFQAAARREIQERKESTDVYQSVRRSLEKRLSLDRQQRGLSFDQEMKIRQLIETCKQKKHVRSFKNMTRSSVNAPQKQKSCSSSGNSLNLNNYLRRQPPRPHTSYQKHKSQGTCQRKAFSFITETSVRKKGRKSAMFKQSKQNSYFQPDKQNFEYKSKSQRGKTSKITTGIAFNYFNLPNKAPKLKKSHLSDHKKILNSRFTSIIQTCKIEKEVIGGIKNKINHFGLFCEKVKGRSSVMQKFCNYVERTKYTLPDEVD